jgi:hypothetical protein
MSGGQVSDLEAYKLVMDEPGPAAPRAARRHGILRRLHPRRPERQGRRTVIPAKRNRKVQPVIDGPIYALNNPVERHSSRLKQLTTNQPTRPPTG